MAKSESAPKFKSLKEAGLENFVVEEMHRSKLVGAEYNPRKISDQERGKLKAALQRHGLVAPVTWNRQTGTLVGGHQRLGIMDSLMGTKDYTLQVSVIDVDAPREKEINILLNNMHAAGSFDLDQLKSMFDDEAVTAEGAGFTTNDIVSLFGEDALNNRTEDLQEFADHLAEISEKYTGVQESNKKKGQGENYLVFTFPDSDHVDRFVQEAGLEDNRYQNGMMLLDKWGIVLDSKKS